MTESDLRAEFDRFAAAMRPRGFAVDWSDRIACLDDRTTTTGFDRHYIYHTAWAARVVARTRPSLHTDVASALYFSTLVSAFLPVRYLEYRPVDVALSDLSCGTADLMRLPFADGSVESLSCMHVVEHVGLGRYGDPLDPDADLTAMAELSRVVAPGGDLLFVVPVGRPRIQFNAHRIYAFEQVRSAFAGMTLQEFALIPDRADGAAIEVGADPARVARQRYGCGCFWFRKPA
jgi:hypothetical protein